MKSVLDKKSFLIELYNANGTSQRTKQLKVKKSLFLELRENIDSLKTLNTLRKTFYQNR
jgi:hypothetical protein